MAINKEVEDRALNAPTVDYVLGSCRSRKYALMKRPIDPFPQPIRIGRSSRWLASAVFGWLARQSGRPVEDKDVLVLASKPKPGSSDTVVSIAPDIAEMKELYESGLTLDELCKRFRIGKGRLSARLRAEGTVMRAPGRSGLTTPKAAASERHPWPLVPDRAARANAGGGVA